eukprot:gene10940-12937_t
MAKRPRKYESALYCFAFVGGMLFLLACSLLPSIEVIITAIFGSSPDTTKHLLGLLPLRGNETDLELEAHLCLGSYACEETAARSARSLSRTTVSEALANLRTIIRPRLLNASRSKKLSCAVIGSSAQALLGHGFGTMINTHSAVLRMNGARVNSYERDVGNATHLMMFNARRFSACKGAMTLVDYVGEQNVASILTPALRGFKGSRMNHDTHYELRKHSQNASCELMPFRCARPLEARELDVLVTDQMYVVEDGA